MYGDVAACYRFSSEEEVLSMANESDYGLSAYFYSRDIGRVWRVAEELEAGSWKLEAGSWKLGS